MHSSPRQLIRPLLSQGASPHVYFPSSSRPNFRLCSLWLPRIAGGHEATLALSLASQTTKEYLFHLDPWWKLVPMMYFPLTHVYSKSECCAVTSINIHVWLCSRRPPVFIKAVLPLPFASRVLWKDIPDLTDVAEVESMCFPPTDASAAVCSSFIMHACSQTLHARRFTGGNQR